MGKLVYGYWNCQYCNSTGIRGDKRNCPNCGRSRDDSVKFYMGSDIEYVPGNKAEHVNRNPDWLCNYCDSLNSDSDTNCKSCGKARDEENLTYFENPAKKVKSKLPKEDSNGKHESRISDYMLQTKHDSTVDSFGRPTNNSSSKVSYKINWRSILIFSLLIAIVIGGIYLLIPKEHDVTIESFAWERAISIEKYKWVDDSDWNLPPSAKLSYTREEIRSYKSVLDHYETRSREVVAGYEDYVSGYRDLGNGYFEEVTSSRPVYRTEYYEEPVYRSEPVYSTKYYYKIQRWVHERDVITSSHDKNPYWGNLNLSSDERESSRNSTYYIFGKDTNQKDINVAVSYDDWCELDVGQTVTLKIILGFGKVIKE